MEQSILKKQEPEGYKQLLNDIKSILQKGLSKAYKAVDNIKVQTYWQIGERIVREELQHKDRAEYGKKVVPLLAPAIGMDEQTLHHIIRFYRSYPILSAVRRELSWTHYKKLIYIINEQERSFYEIQSIINGWSTRELEKRMKNEEFIKAKRNNKLVVKLPPQLPAPEDIFKENYDFDFLSLEKGYSEKDLENGLLLNVEKLLLEFGSDFSVSGRQRKLVIDSQLHTIDLELYHRGIPCIVLVDLKIGRFKAEHTGQMNKFLNFYRENKRYPWEKDPVGLIICEYMGKEEVHYALGNIQNKIFVAEYKTKLPSEEEIRLKLKRKAEKNDC